MAVISSLRGRHNPLQRPPTVKAREVDLLRGKATILKALLGVAAARLRLLRAAALIIPLLLLAHLGYLHMASQARPAKSHGAVLAADLKQGLASSLQRGAQSFIQEGGTIAQEVSFTARGVMNLVRGAGGGVGGGGGSRVAPHRSLMAPKKVVFASATTAGGDGGPSASPEHHALDASRPVTASAALDEAPATTATMKKEEMQTTAAAAAAAATGAAAKVQEMHRPSATVTATGVAVERAEGRADAGLTGGVTEGAKQDRKEGKAQVPAAAAAMGGGSSSGAAGKGVAAGGAAAAPTKEEVPLGDIPAGPTGEEVLTVDIARGALAPYALSWQYGKWDLHDPMPATAAPCAGALECPVFGRCEDAPGRAFAAMCRNADLVDALEHGQLAANYAPPPPPPPPLGAAMPPPPAAGAAASNLAKAAAPAGKRKRKAKGPVQLPYEGNVMLLENVYVNAHGLVFNATHLFMAGGCMRWANFSYPAATTRVTRFKVLVNAITWHSKNFYHTLIETLPDFIVLGKVLRAHKNIPVAFHKEQGDPAISSTPRWLSVLGFNASELNVHAIDFTGHLFFADRLLMPAHGFCGKPGAAVLRKLREDHLGLPPMPAQRRPASAMAKETATWRIVLGARARKPRNIPQHDALVAGLVSRYGAARVSVFWGNLTLAGTRAAFRDAALYIGPHGAGMTNLLFLPPGAAVLEVRPAGYDNPCYHYLSDRCRLDYYVVFGTGEFKTSIEVNATRVLEQVEKILPPGEVAPR